MTGLPIAELERRLLILAPVGRDSELIERMLAPKGVACCACRDAEHLARELARGGAVVLLTEEAYADDPTRCAALVADQPPWSDLPVLLLTAPGADSLVATRAQEVLGNVTLLERPVRVPALASAARSALRARQRQYEARRHLDDRDQANLRKDQFLATLAHELRNPLAPIRNAIEILRAAPEGHSRDWLFKVLERQVAQMVRMIDDLMDVSRITRGKIELRLDPVPLSSVIAVAVEASRPLIDSNEHQFRLSLPDERIVLYADAVRLAQVFSNLLNNAARYTDRGGRIELSAAREGDMAVVRIADTGVGIPEDALATVFEMFAQVDGQDSRAQSGLGIGLTLAKSLVEMHGGRISASSGGRGRGSQFEVRLPVYEHGASFDPEPQSLHGALRAGYRVLVVDDNQDAADMLANLLRLLQADVRVVYDGQSALDLMDVFRPEAIVLDLGMPGMDGYEVARRVRAQPAGARLALIALSGWGQERDRERTAEVGFDVHLVKPVDLDRILTVLRELDGKSSRAE